ncbi:hypothetical protein Taro_015279 [Colocasia esculenta]|uniref:Uncharacterized protein n=1 Tax=Colocasia esculenta TaxID=4460 RepID=A0A843UB31_COLES|nr:hypothetical protein [Colocasia esculenta]
MDAYLYRSRSVKQPGIKQALKRVKATVKAAKGAIKGVPAHTTESPYFQSMLDAIAEAGPGLKAPTRKMVDGDDKNDMGYLYEPMDKAKEKLRERNSKAYRKWWAIIHKRWEMTLHHDLHAAGYFFNPRIQYKDNVHNDGEVMRGTMNVITRLARTMNERLDAMAEVERYKMKVGIYRGYDMTYAAQRPTPVPEIDVDELLNEEHPLHAWVETRAEGDIPDFHPDDRLVQTCEEDVLLEEHVPERGERPELRRSSTVHDTRISSSQPELRRSTSQLGPKRKKDKGKKKAKEERTEEPRRKSQEGEEDSPEAETHIGQPFSEAPPLPPHLAKII